MGGGGFGGRGGVRVDVNGEVKLLCKFKKKILGGGGRVSGRGQGGCECGCFFFCWGGRVRGGSCWKGGQGGWEWRSEAFVKIQKKKFFFFLGGGGRVKGGGSGWGGSGWMGTEK